MADSVHCACNRSSNEKRTDTTKDYIKCLAIAIKMGFNYAFIAFVCTDDWEFFLEYSIPSVMWPHWYSHLPFALLKANSINLIYINKNIFKKANIPTFWQKYCYVWKNTKHSIPSKPEKIGTFVYLYEKMCAFNLISKPLITMFNETQWFNHFHWIFKIDLSKIHFNNRNERKWTIIYS